MWRTVLGATLTGRGTDGIAKKSTFQLSVPQLGHLSSFNAPLERSKSSASCILAYASVFSMRSDSVGLSGDIFAPADFRVLILSNKKGRSSWHTDCGGAWG